MRWAGGDFKVGIADSWNKYQDGIADPLIKGGADILLCDAFSYWKGQTLANSSGSFFDDIMQAFGHIQNVFLNMLRGRLLVGLNFGLGRLDGQLLGRITKLRCLVLMPRLSSGRMLFVASLTGA